MAAPARAARAEYAPCDPARVQAWWTPAEPFLKGAIVISAAVLAAWGLADLVRDRVSFWPTAGSARAAWGAIVSFAGLMYAALIWRLSLWWRYRPAAPVEERRLPFISVIIPAFNEGALVRKAIRSAACSRYMCDRLEVIVIDDGSTDDTWMHIEAATNAVRREVPQVSIRTFRHGENLGKRAALALGFRHARGEVFVTVDSDSVLDPEALRRGVAPLIRDGRIGCVAGCVRVLNDRQSVMTRFLKCTFSLSFRFTRAYQNGFRGVFCTPGALSFYRADVVRRVLDEWASQRFLGLPCTTGEDRAMTNLFLRDGWLTAYQGDAVVHCRMPHTYAGVVKMFLRWGRSNIRETVLLLRFLFTRFRRKHLWAFRINMLLAITALVLPPVLIASSAVLAATVDGYLWRNVVAVFSCGALFSAVYYRNERDSGWVYLLLYHFFWVLFLSWIIPYAALTLRNTGWLTRGAAAPADGAEPDGLGARLTLEAA